jgi:hypothetical protein
MYPRVGFCSEVPDNAGADKKIALATIARRYIQLRGTPQRIVLLPLRVGPHISIASFSYFTTCFTTAELLVR